MNNRYTFVIKLYDKPTITFYSDYKDVHQAYLEYCIENQVIPYVIESFTRDNNPLLMI